MSLRRPTALFLAAAMLLACRPAILLAEGAFAQPETAPATSITERRMQTAIQSELAKLKQRENSLQKQELELKTLQSEVDKRLTELEKVRAEVTRLLERKTEQEATKVKGLSKIYEKMEPSKAASAITGLDIELAVEILQNMKVKAAGRILDNLDTQSAAKLSSSFPALARD